MECFPSPTWCQVGEGKQVSAWEGEGGWCQPGTDVGDVEVLRFMRFMSLSVAPAPVRVPGQSARPGDSPPHLTSNTETFCRLF